MCLQSAEDLLLQVGHALHQVRVLLCELLGLLRQVLDTVILPVIAQRPHVSGDQQHRARERGLKAEQQVEQNERWRVEAGYAQAVHHHPGGQHTRLDD